MLRAGALRAKADKFTSELLDGRPRFLVGFGAGARTMEVPFPEGSATPEPGRYERRWLNVAIVRL